MRSRVSILAGLLALSTLSACATDPHDGYSFTSPYSAQVRTIAVPIFTNKTSEPGLETLLTEAVIKELAMRGWEVSQSAATDTTLVGTLTGSELRKLSNDPRTGLVQELAVVMTIDFEWRDNRTGKTLVARRNFSASDTFAPSRGGGLGGGGGGGGEPIEAGRFSTYSTLAKDLVQELREAW